jgi:hypothetical protein
MSQLRYRDITEQALERMPEGEERESIHLYDKKALLERVINFYK